MLSTTTETVGVRVVLPALVTREAACSLRAVARRHARSARLGGTISYPLLVLCTHHGLPAALCLPDSPFVDLHAQEPSGGACCLA